MLAGHAPALASALLGSFNSGDDLLRSISLSLVTVFFCLKIIDVAWLRVPPDGHSRLAMLLVVAMLHAGVVERVVDKHAGTSVALSEVLLAGGVLAAAGLATRLLRGDGAGRERSRRRCMRDQVARVLERLTDAHVLPERMRLARAALLNRAPPHALS